MRHVRAPAAVVVVVLFGLVAAVSAAAQDESPAASPAGSPAAAVSAVLIGGGQPVVAPGHELTLRRVTLPPGTGIPAHTHPGALVIYLESGTWGYTPLSGIVRLTRAAVDGASPSPAEDLVMETEVILNAGDVLYVEEPADDIRNAGEDDVVLLVAGLTRIGEPFTMLMEDMPTPSGSPTP